MQVVTLDFLKENNLVIVDKNALLATLSEAGLSNSVDKRFKWITKKQAIAKYNVTRHWLDSAEKNSSAVLKVNVGRTKTATKKYLEQSIIDEQNRQYHGR
jgi:hypothetical protein